MVIEKTQPWEQGKVSFALRKEVKGLPCPQQKNHKNSVKQTAEQQDKAAAWGSSISDWCQGLGIA